MKEIFNNAKDFKIIPNNFKNSCELLIEEVTDKTIRGKLILSDECDLSDYKKGETVELFGVNGSGLIYMETVIMEHNNDIVLLDATRDYSVIQRREYSRVKMDYGSISFKDMPDNIVIKIDDISAGGVKLTTNAELKEDTLYDIEIRLSGNMRIECSIQPIRVQKDSEGNYNISGRFVDLENIDRIVLVQYVFKKKMENSSR